MGLKQVKFIDWFQSKFPEAVRNVPNQEGSHFDSVFIDINCILHPSVRAATNEAMFVKKLFSILDKLLSQFIPSRICYLSVDGPAPVAKILTQKARRAVKGSRSGSKGMSTLQVTPGCPFMARLEHYLSYYSVRYLQHRQALGISPDLKFVIDHSNNPGEGESKIIENIVQQAANIRGRPCAIITMDSDSVLQAIALGISNVYVIRKDSPFNPAVVISIDKLMRTLEETFPGESNRVRLDFCALCLFRGNDYLRGLYIGLEKLWTSYLFTKLIDTEIKQRGELGFLIDSECKTFDLFFLRRLIFNSYKNPNQLQVLPRLQQQLLQQGPQELEPARLSPKENKVEDPELESQSDSDSVDENKSDSETEGDSEITLKEESEDEADSKGYSVKKFLAGILWNLEMYCAGTCPDVSFCYEYQYGPPRRALTAYIDSISQSKQHAALLPNTTNEILGVTRSDKKYLHPLVCGLILLPVDTGAAYLPQSISSFHSQLVAGQSKHLTQEEMEEIDLKVATLIEILESSGKSHDAEIAKELSGLYTTRPPYIWTRVRVINPRSKPIAMPASPNFIIDQLANKQATIIEDTSTSPLHMFSTLQEQPDIKCNMVKVQPNVVQSQILDSNASSSTQDINVSIKWAVIERQQAIALAGKAPATRWPFHYVRGNHNRKLPGQNQPQLQNQGQARPQSHAQNQGRNQSRNKSQHQNQHQNQKKSTNVGRQEGQNHRPKQNQDVSAAVNSGNRERRSNNNNRRQLHETENDPSDASVGSQFSALTSNTIGFAFAIETPLEPKKGVTVVAGEEDLRQDEAEIEIPDINPLDPAFQATLQHNVIIAGLTNNDTASEDGKSTKETPPSPENEQLNPIPHSQPKRRLARVYYAQLSAPPGTDEAKAEHALIKAALIALPGHVTIRQEFGADRDDVLNVISFKLEGDEEGLEVVAALQGIVGIYPVRTRKRPKALPLGSLKLTRPNLQSAHILTGINMVHQKLGLTGKGIKVGIIDTGVDYKHPALGGCFGRGCKVAFGYDFVGDNYDNGDPEKDIPRPDPDPMDCAGHGTHVAGIVAARNEGPTATGAQQFIGVAPDVTIGAYRVFGCDGEVSDDILLAALKAAYRDGMDVVNLSLGGSSGWPEEPFAIACSAYVAKGLHLAIANGNDGEQGLFEDGAPATAVGAVAVGSVDNTHFMGTAADLSWQAVDRRGVVTWTGGAQGAVGRIGMAIASDKSDVSMNPFNGDIIYVIHIPTADPFGCTAYNNVVLEAEHQVPRSRVVVLLRRGECTFSDKAKFVAEANLGGMLVYDTVPEQRPLGMTIAGYNVSAGGLSFEDATLIINSIAAKASNPVLKSQGRKLTARFSSTDQALKLASGGKISDFSSWGPDARLRYKPDIVTPGGMIYSTFPLAKGGFATLQGTSMASPYMAGIQALYLSKHGKTNSSKLLNLMQSTAIPTVRPGSARGLTSVFQQGGGLVSMKKLFSDESPTIVTPTTLYLNDTQFQKLDHDITFNNPSTTETRIWKMAHRPAFSVNGFEDDGRHYTPVNQSRLRISEHGASRISASPMQLKLAPGATGTIHIHINPPTMLNIQERWLYSGYIEFHCHTVTGAACDSSVISYGGMHGRLADIPILNPALAYPALQLDRYDLAKGSRAKNVDNKLYSSVSGDISEDGIKHGKGETDKQKSQFRDQFEHVVIGKSEQDWVQILVSINFPTGLLTIEAESVCDNDHTAGSRGDKIRLEIGGTGRSRFQIETESELEVEEQIVDQVGRLKADDQLDGYDSEIIALMKARLARLQELAFMPGGLYMPYEGYSQVMLQPSAVEEVVRLHRKMNQQGGNAAKAKQGVGKVRKTKTNKRFRNSRSKTSLAKKDRKKGKGNRRGNTKDKNLPHKADQARKGRGKKWPDRMQNVAPRIRQPCVPRILGLIPSGFNPWNTRTDSSESNSFQSFSWMGDLLLQNHDVASIEQDGDGGRHMDGKKRGKEQDKSVMELTRDLPDGRYRLVVKVLKPWGVRGRASDVERWSSPIIVIKRAT
ncbi:hypothetical protein BGX27_009075 [Mortierella sp. AM989]|nr:hypothetical protein BGX27_009075 [Mortierella sp. AM989]